MKTKFVFGLFGCSDEGILYMPSGKRLFKLPKRIAFKVHGFLNDHIGYVGLQGTKLLKRR